MRFQHRSQKKSHVFPRKISKAAMEADRSRLTEKWKTEIDEELDSPDVPTFETYSRQWLTDVADELEPKTVKRYQQDIEGHVIPAFGAHRLDEITPKMIREFLREKEGAVNSKTGKRYARDTVRLMKASLSSVLSGAVEDEYIERNPVLDVQRGKRKRAGYVSVQEQAKRMGVDLIFTMVSTTYRHTIAGM